MTQSKAHQRGNARRKKYPNHGPRGDQHVLHGLSRIFFLLAFPLVYPLDWPIDRSSLSQAVRDFLSNVESHLNTFPAFVNWRTKQPVRPYIPNALGRLRTKRTRRGKYPNHGARGDQHVLHGLSRRRSRANQTVRLVL
jgi:hypothetical protein